MRVELVSEDKTNDTIARRIGDGWFLPKLPSIQDEVTVPIWTIQDVHGKHCVWNRTNNNIGQTRKLYTSLFFPPTLRVYWQPPIKTKGEIRHSEGTKNLVTTEQIGVHLYQHFFICSWGHESCVSSGRGGTGTTIEKRYTDKFVVVTSNSSSGTSLEIYTVTEE